VGTGFLRPARPLNRNHTAVSHLSCKVERIDVRRALTSATLVLATAACTVGGEQQEPRSVVSEPDCLPAWNAVGNERNRADLAATRFRHGEVSDSITISDFADGRMREQEETTAFGCGFLFHNDTRFASFHGTWKGNTITWNRRQNLTGPWGPKQQRLRTDNLLVVSAGHIRPKPAARR
jgi:hypothetical protein